jgi:osomolarity two-component system response regulator SKN7
MYGQEQQMVISGMDDENRINNPFSGMGIPDEQYTVMLQNVMNGNNFMNGIDGTHTSSSSASISISSAASSSMSSPPLVSPPVMGSINGMMNTGLAMTNVLGMSLRGEKRAYDSYDDIGPSRSNGREKRSRFEVIE